MFYQIDFSLTRYFLLRTIFTLTIFQEGMKVESGNSPNVEPSFHYKLYEKIPPYCYLCSLVPRLFYDRFSSFPFHLLILRKSVKIFFSERDC